MFLDVRFCDAWQSNSRVNARGSNLFGTVWQDGRICVDWADVVEAYGKCCKMESLYCDFLFSNCAFGAVGCR